MPSNKKGNVYATPRMMLLSKEKEGKFACQTYEQGYSYQSVACYRGPANSSNS
jgi:hypothetical protein